MSNSHSGLDHESNIRKMRLLTFLQLAEETPEMSFSFLQTQLQLQPQQVEPFIIEGKVWPRCAVSGVLLILLRIESWINIITGRLLSRVKWKDRSIYSFTNNFLKFAYQCVKLETTADHNECQYLNE